MYFIAGIVAAIIYAALCFGFGMLIAKVYTKLKENSKNKNMLKQIVVVEVNDNGNHSTAKMSVADLLYDMDHWECTPFTPKQILEAKFIKTDAYGWSYTSFTLVMPDGSEISSDVIYEDVDAL